MLQLVRGSLRDGGAIRELPVVSQRPNAARFHAHQLGHLHQLFSPHSAA